MIMAAALAAGPASAGIQSIELPPSRTQGLDMILVDAEAMPAEPEHAGELAEVEDISWSGAPIDLLKPVHHVYTDLRRQLNRYEQQWGGLPQVRIPAGTAMMTRGSTDRRVAILRERLGLAREGGFDAQLQTKLSDYQRAHGLPATGKVDADTLASLNRGAAYYQRLILLNMERARRLPSSDAKGRYILVDAGSARLSMYEDGRVVDSMKVIVGTAESKTPMMAALLRYASVNPYWNVPPDLVKKTIAPRVLSEGRTYLDDRRYEVLDSWDDSARVVDPATVDWQAAASGELELRVRQRPGEGNFMGDIKFMMPNEHGIYLHDTPGKVLFNEENRWLSNGCVRVEDARRLARWLFGTMPQGSSPDREEQVPLETPVPVYITYLTVGTSANGLAFRPDRYERDAPLLARFKGDAEQMVDAAPPAVAEAASAASRKPPTKTVVKAAAKPPATAAKPAKAATLTKAAAKGPQPAAKAAKPAAKTAAKPAAGKAVAIASAAKPKSKPATKPAVTKTAAAGTASARGNLAR